MSRTNPSTNDAREPSAGTIDPRVSRAVALRGQRDFTAAAALQGRSNILMELERPRIWRSRRSPSPNA